MIEVVANAFEFGVKKGIDVYVDLLEKTINKKGHMDHELLVHIKTKIDKVVEQFIELISCDTKNKH